MSTRIAITDTSSEPTAYEETGHSLRVAPAGSQLHWKLILDQVERKEITAVEASRRLGVARSWFYELRRRYEAEGERGLDPRSRMKPRHDLRLSDELIDAIVEYTLRHPKHGERRIARSLGAPQNGGWHVSHAAVGTVLRRAGLSRAEFRHTLAGEQSSVEDRVQLATMARPDGNGRNLAAVDEPHLLRLSIGGDIEAFAHLYERYRPTVLAVCLQHLRDRALAEDVTQDTFLRAFHALRRFESGRRLLPWLRAIARNRAIDVLRRTGRTTLKDPTDGTWSIPALDSSPLDESIATEQRVRLQKALERLPSRQQRVLTLFALHGWTYRDIAAAEGTTVLAIKSLMFRARANLRRACGDGLLGTALLPLRRVRAWLWARHDAHPFEALVFACANQIVAGLAVVIMTVGGTGLGLPSAAAVAVADRDGAAIAPAPASTRLVARHGAVGSTDRAPGETSPDEVADLLPRYLQEVTDPEGDVEDPEDAKITSIVASPNVAQDHTLFAVGHDMCEPGCGTEFVLFRSTDEGESWKLLTASGLTGHTVLLPPDFGAGSSRIFAMGAEGLQESTDGGESFRPVAVGTAALQGSAAISPLFAQGDPRILIGATTMIEYDDETKTEGPAGYSAFPGPLEPAFSPDFGTDGLLLVGGRQSTFDESGKVGVIYICTSQMCGTADLSGFVGGTPTIRFPSDYAAGGTVFALAREGILRSTDGGATFAPIPTPLDDGYTDLAVGPGGTHLVATAQANDPVANGVLVSDDGGEHWYHSFDPLVAGGVSVVALTQSRIVVGTSEGIACSGDNGQTWSRRCTA
ncbi:MAG TPA: sigma-70 family RNA polymerase sigma factor [Actinomycetota bacterium]